MKHPNKLTNPFFCTAMRAISTMTAYVAIVLLVQTLLSGCIYRGAKITEGVDFSAGVSIPQSEGVAQVSFVNYLSGFRLGVAENSGMECEYFGTNTLSFAFGLYESQQVKHFKAKVEPCETVPAEKEDADK